MSARDRFRRAVAMVLWKLLNPAAVRFAGIAPWWVVLETKGRESGRPRRVPLARGPATDETVWLIAVHGPHASFVKNLLADPEVRLKIRREWRSGQAHLQPLDARRLAQFNFYARGGPKTMGIDPAFVRIDLHQGGSPDDPDHASAR